MWGQQACLFVGNPGASKGYALLGSASLFCLGKCRGVTCSMAASTAASVALVKGTTSLPVKRTRICTAVMLLPLVSPEAAGAAVGTALVLMADAPGGAAGANMGLLAEAPGAKASQ